MDDNIFHRNLKKTYPVVERGEDIWLWDTEGKKYLDAASGTMVANIGHGRLEVAEAMFEQAKKVSFPWVVNFTSKAEMELAKRIIELAPESLSKVWWTCSGTEATETAMKCSRQYFLELNQPEKYKIVSRWMSFHGNTIGALSMTGHFGLRKNYIPYLCNFPKIVPPYCYRCPFGREYPNCDIECAWDFERIVKCEGPETISAFIGEVEAGGLNGLITAPREYFGIIRSICDKYDILLIVDEVITGFGRCGKNFAIEYSGVTPDFIVCGKGIASGYTPMAAVIVHERIIDVFEKGSGSFVHGNTYMGNPVSCATGLACLEYTRKHRLFENVAQLSPYLFEKFRNLLQFPIIGDIRGLGFLLGIEFVADKMQKTPFDRKLRVAERVFEKALEKGVILRPGTGNEVSPADYIAISPPLSITKPDIDLIYQVTEDSIESILKEIG
jgi:adenosylmethionine-8-amino-7-oxononanoate aminotransferase